jgi:hypothetical protein
MTALAEPPSRTTGTAVRARRRGEPELTPEQRARLHARQTRNEIIGVIAFCVVLAVVFAMRNYAS